MKQRTRIDLGRSYTSKEGRNIHSSKKLIKNRKERTLYTRETSQSWVLQVHADHRSPRATPSRGYALCGLSRPVHPSLCRSDSPPSDVTPEGQQQPQTTSPAWVTHPASSHHVGTRSPHTSQGRWAHGTGSWEPHSHTAFIAAYCCNCSVLLLVITVNLSLSPTHKPDFMVCTYTQEKTNAHRVWYWSLLSGIRSGSWNTPFTEKQE